MLSNIILKNEVFEWLNTANPQKKSVKKDYLKLLFLIQFIRKILWLCPNFIYKTSKKLNTFELATTSNSLFVFLIILKDYSEFHFNSLVDIFVCDIPGKKNRFSITYNLSSRLNGVRLQLNVVLQELTPICSVVSLFRSAN